MGLIGDGTAHDRSPSAIGAYAPLLRLDRAAASKALRFSGLGGPGARQLGKIDLGLTHNLGGAPCNSVAAVSILGRLR